MKKKIVIAITILVILFTYSPFIKASSETKSYQEQQFDDLLENGQATVKSDSDEGKKSEVIGISPTPSQQNGLINGLSTLISIIPLALNKIMALIAFNYEDTVVYEGKEMSLFTIEGLLTNKYPLFDIDLFKKIEGPNSEFSNTIKDNVAIWYISIRNLSAIGCMIILIYVGIRIAIATTAEDKAKYKQMLTGWIVGMLLLFLIHYIVIIMIRISNTFISFISSAIESDTQTTSMEMVVLTNSIMKVQTAEGWNKIYFTALYLVLTFYEIKFFIMYLFRVFKIFIMMAISPLICMTYPIDKIGDGKAQGFNKWFKELSIEIFIQPVHLLIYVLFIYSAGEIAKTIPIIAIFFIVALDNGEKIIRNVLKIAGKGLKDIDIMGKGK